MNSHRLEKRKKKQRKDELNDEIKRFNKEVHEILQKTTQNQIERGLYRSI